MCHEVVQFVCQFLSLVRELVHLQLQCLLLHLKLLETARESSISGVGGVGGVIGEGVSGKGVSGEGAIGEGAIGEGATRKAGGRGGKLAEKLIHFHAEPPVCVCV